MRTPTLRYPRLEGADGVHVLLVDRDPVLRRAAAQLLPRFRVDTATRADEAFLAFERRPYEALVVDECLGLPSERLGIALAGAVRRRSFETGIVLTSDAPANDLEVRARRAGIDAILSREELRGPILRAAVENAVAARACAGPRPTEKTHLPRALQALVDDARDTLAEGRIVQAEQVYRIALVARAASSDVTGTRLASEAARALELTRHSLLDYGLLASRFTAAEFRELLAVRRTVHGDYITVSHLQQLAKLPRGAREVWIERSFAEGLTVRQLRAVVSSQRPRKDDQAP